MSISTHRIKTIICLLPYLLLLLLGSWYRCKISGIVFLDGDSEHYLMPPVIKTLIGEWHKGERPMQYLLFIYYTLSSEVGIKYTIIAQQFLGLLSGAFLGLAWLKTLSKYSELKWYWHILGYMLLGIYISSPAMMYYERFLGPESVSIFLMCLVILCLSIIYGNKLNNLSKYFIASFAIFLNLYLTNPMPKWIFISLFLEFLFLWSIIKNKTISTKTKTALVLVPHFFYLLLVLIPEVVNKVDNANENRIYIEYQQMAFTHFDLLMNDKTNLELTENLQDSIVKEFKVSQINPYPIIGFSSDYLMWGRANNFIDEYYDHNFDSIKNYFIQLNWILVTKYPWDLAKSIAKQLFYFYIPNSVIRKNLYGSSDLESSYSSNLTMLNDFDTHIIHKLEWYSRNDSITIRKATAYYISNKYPSSISSKNSYDPVYLPQIISHNFFFYRHFDEIFVLFMIMVFMLKIYSGQLFEWHIITILYAIIFIYVLTIGIVHSFDIERFTITIYPFLLFTTCLALAYVGDSFFKFFYRQKAN